MAIYPIRPVAEDELAGFLAVDQHASHGTPLSGSRPTPPHLTARWTGSGIAIRLGECPNPSIAATPPPAGEHYSSGRPAARSNARTRLRTRVHSPGAGSSSARISPASATYLAA